MEIKEPDQVNYGSSSTINNPSTCEDGGRLKCHTSARCENTPSGFCCHCKDGFYGNGLSCIKNDVPLHVSGKVTGSINNVEIDGHLQSYVVLIDGRSYSAITPMPREIGFSAQLTAAFGNTLSWLFAKPIGNDAVPNGYQVANKPETVLNRVSITMHVEILFCYFSTIELWKCRKTWVFYSYMLQ